MEDLRQQIQYAIDNCGLEGASRSALIKNFNDVLDSIDEGDTDSFNFNKTYLSGMIGGMYLVGGLKDSHYDVFCELMRKLHQNV